jgi:hypothetical protein
MIPLIHRPEDINTYTTHSYGLFSWNLEYEKRNGV